MKSLWIVIIVVSGILISSNSCLVAAQEPSATITPTISEPTPTAAEIQTSSFSGVVEKINGDTVVVNTNGNFREVVVPGNVNVTKNGTGSSVNQIEPGDRITVTENSNGGVVSVDVVSGQLVDTVSVGLPIIIGILLLLAIIYFWWRKSQEGHIKTSSK
jgi:hypothetical protein